MVELCDWLVVGGGDDGDEDDDDNELGELLAILRVVIFTVIHDLELHYNPQFPKLFQIKTPPKLSYFLHGTLIPKYCRDQFNKYLCWTNNVVEFHSKTLKHPHGTPIM